MKWIFIIIGFVTAFIGLGNLLVSIIHWIPYAKKVSKSNELAKAQRIDGKLDLWYGPVPYGSILLGPIIFLIIFIVVSIIVILFSPEYIKEFSIGILIAIIWHVVGLYDPRGRFKRDFNLTLGDNWWSKALKEGSGTLKDEQKLRDLPVKVDEARKFLLSKQGDHKDTKKIQEYISILTYYDKPILEPQEQVPPHINEIRNFLISNEGKNVNSDEVKKAVRVLFEYGDMSNYPKNLNPLILIKESEDKFVFKKALLYYTVRKNNDEGKTHHFFSTEGILENNP